MQVDLTNNIALVTGASRGIGKAIALKLGKSGAVVIGTSTSEAGAEQISHAFELAGIKGHGVTLDVTNKTQIYNNTSSSTMVNHPYAPPFYISHA